MVGFQAPGVFFLTALAPTEQKFLKTLMENARKNGYTKFVEPCAGAFAMSHLASQVGFKPAQIEASDVSMFSTIMGYTIMGKPLDELCLHATGFTDEELLDPATAMYAWKYLSMAKRAGKDYFYNYLIDMEQRRDFYVESIREQLERAKKILGGFSYRALDMWKHIDEVIDDPHALVIANPPTYAAGFEKYYDTLGNMTWREPEYEIFDPETGLRDLFDKVRDAKCLVICYEENATGEMAGSPIFARPATRDGMNVYLTSNRADEAEALAEGKKIARPKEQELSPLKCPIMPIDAQIEENAEIAIRQIERPTAQYYRKLWTHKFTGTPAMSNFAIFINNQIVGVFGINKTALTMGAFGSRVSDAIFIMYGMTIPHKIYRLHRLIPMLAQNRKFIDEICTDLERVKARTLKTIQMTKYPESKEMRGIMKLEERKKDDKFGYRLVYTSDFKDRTEQQTLVEWLRKEKRWQTLRQKNQK